MENGTILQADDHRDITRFAMHATILVGIAMLSAPAPVAAEGFVRRIDLTWPLPPWATLLVALAAVLFVVGLYLRERGPAPRSYRMILAALRLAVLGIAVLMIAQMALSLQRIGRPRLVLIVDDTLSMTVADPYPDGSRETLKALLNEAGLENRDLSRWNLQCAILADRNAEFLRRLAEKYALDLYFVSDVSSVRAGDAAAIVKEMRSRVPKAESTELGLAVRSVLDESSRTTPAAILLLTDGINTAGPPLADAAEIARRRGVPLYFIGFGSDQPDRDVRLSGLAVNDWAFVNDLVNFECQLTTTGFQGRNITVTLREKGKPAVLAKIEVAAGRDGEPQTVYLPYRPPQVGEFEYVVQAEPQQGELQADNNRQTCTIQVRKEKLRVLLAQAHPSFEFRYLRNLLQRDETIALNTVLQDADVESSRQDPAALSAFPSHRDELFAYDVIILGDLNPSLINAAALQHLVDFVDRPVNGGALILIAGPSYMPASFRETPLARLFPFDIRRLRPAPKDSPFEQGFFVRPTNIGLAAPAMQLGDTPEKNAALWRSLPPFYWLLELPELKPGVRVLAEAVAQADSDRKAAFPVFCFQYFGSGRLLFHATDETWRWRYRVGDRYFARYWIQTIRDLGRSTHAETSRPVVLATDRREYKTGDFPHLTVRFADERWAPREEDGVLVAIESHGKKTLRISPRRVAATRGLFESRLGPLAPGSYRASLMAPVPKELPPSVEFTVVQSDGELSRLGIDAAAMSRAARHTGGRFETLPAAERIFDALPEPQPVLLETLPDRPLWNRWPLLMIFLGLLTLEWTLRRRLGMV